MGPSTSRSETNTAGGREQWPIHPRYSRCPRLWMDAGGIESVFLSIRHHGRKTLERMGLVPARGEIGGEKERKRVGIRQGWGNYNDYRYRR